MLHPGELPSAITHVCREVALADEPFCHLTVYRSLHKDWKKEFRKEHNLLTQADASQEDRAPSPNFYLETLYTLLGYKSLEEVAKPPQTDTTLNIGAVATNQE